MHHQPLTARWFLLVLCSLPGMALPQAPGAVGSGDKRTPINQGMLPLTINRAGSYYLANNLTWDNDGTAITINDTTVGDNRVTIDLNGFELRRSLPAAGNTFGISVIGGDGNSIAISNGTITGFQYGVLNYGSGLRVERMGFSRNNIGIHSSAGGATLAHCTFTVCGTGVSISSGTVTGGNVVIDCAAKECGVGFSGISLFDRCSAHAITDRAFRLLSGATMRNCTVNGVVGASLEGAGNVVENSRFADCSTWSIAVWGTNNRVVDNHAVGPNSLAANAGGIVVGLAATGNYLAGNSIAGHWTNQVLSNYDIRNPDNRIEVVLVQLPQRITWPGTVLLRGSLLATPNQSGITVVADNVTIDLGGHALIGVSNSTDGISVPSTRKNLVVMNGTISGFGGTGIAATNVTSGRYANLTLDGNGGYGLSTGSSANVESCTATGNTLSGIITAAASQVRGCVAVANGGVGISLGARSQALDCQCSNNTGSGVFASDGSDVSRCELNNNVREGVFANNGCKIVDCNLRENGLDGIRVGWSCSVLRNNTNGNGTAAGTQGGILVIGSANRIEGNNHSYEDRGVLVSGTGNIILKNTANSAPFQIAAGNSHGPLITVANVGDITGVAGANHPWANFIF